MITRIKCEVRTLSEQVREAFERSGMTVAELLEKSGLDIDRSALHRRLHDGARETPMKTSEAEALATALGIELHWPVQPTRRQRKRKKSAS